MTLSEFFDKHHGIRFPGWQWVIDNCRTPREAFMRAPEPLVTIWIATRPSVLDTRDKRAFAAFVCGRVTYLIKSADAMTALKSVEACVARTGAGLSMQEAHALASRACDDPRWTMTAEPAAYCAHYAVKRATEETTSAVMIEASSRYTRRAVGEDAWSAAGRTPETSWVYTEASDAEAKAQANWLKRNARPDFKK